MTITNPLTRFQTLWPGQMGVSGSDVPRGIRAAPGAITMYVSDVHPGRIAVGDGTDPEHPLSTMAVAITTLIAHATAQSQTLDGSVIVVDNAATIAETVIVPATAPKGVAIVGAGNSPHAPTWTAATAAGIALDIRAEGWVIEGITFETGAAGTGIRLSEVPASSYSAYKTTIQNCRFDGLWGGLYGVEFYGAPHRVTIQNCEFLEYRTGATTAFAIMITDTHHTNPYECHIRDNMFWENENHIGNLGGIRGFNVSTFTGNIFHEGQLIATTIKLDLRGGSQGENIVTGNVFQGDYSNTGGYYAHAVDPGLWVGNISNDLLEAEVSDSGFTVAPPAA